LDYFVTKHGVDYPDGAKSAVLEDSIMQKGYPVTAGSKMLENFISPINATVVSRIEAAGVAILGKTKMDEFGAGGIFPDSQVALIGDKGTTSGAVAAVADGVATFALCNDYTGAISREAAKNGLYYLHPTYGTVSRYGLIPAVGSIDQIGIVCKTPEAGFEALSIIAGHDKKDGAMLATATSLLLPNELRINNPSDEAKPKYYDLYEQIMQVLCCAELANNISRYDGIKYGYRASEYKDLQELYINSRTEAFGINTKLAAIAGAMVLSQENYLRLYDKAMRIRRLIKDSLDFDKCDAIVLKGTDLAALALPRLCGLPAITMPYGESAVTIVAAPQREDILMAALEAVEL